MLTYSSLVFFLYFVPAAILQAITLFATLASLDHLTDEQKHAANKSIRLAMILAVVPILNVFIILNMFSVVKKS